MVLIFTILVFTIVVTENTKTKSIKLLSLAAARQPHERAASLNDVLHPA